MKTCVHYDIDNFKQGARHVSITLTVSQGPVEYFSTLTVSSFLQAWMFFLWALVKWSQTLVKGLVGEARFCEGCKPSGRSSRLRPSLSDRLQADQCTAVQAYPWVLASPVNVQTRRGSPLNKDPSRCNSTNRKNLPIRKGCVNFLTKMVQFGYPLCNIAYSIFYDSLCYV